MDIYTAVLCATVLIAAGVLELVTSTTDQVRYSGLLAAFGFWMLGSRYVYLVANDDLGRLSIYGTASIGAIGMGRIIACVALFRR